jgi:hypothetical protein
VCYCGRGEERSGKPQLSACAIVGGECSGRPWLSACAIYCGRGAFREAMAVGVCYILWEGSV